MRTLQNHVFAALAAVALCGAMLPSGAHAQAREELRSTVIDGAPPPVLPASITRDDRGRATVRAIRLETPLVLDGRLDDAVYEEYQPFGGFVQVVPVAGDPSSERTDVWVAFDEDNIYVTCRCWDSASPEQWVINEYRRDTSGLRNNEHSA